VILIFGKSGQVATELGKLAPDARFLSRAEADLSRPKDCFDAVMAHTPTAVINAAAYTAVDAAEENEPLAQRINAEAPEMMARACATLSIPFVHISTDYVFDGTGTDAFKPSDTAHPINTYGQTKLSGERAVVNSGATYAILRTSWVFSASGQNFVKTMLRLSETHATVRVVADQLGGPTPAVAIAHACLTIAEALRKAPEKSGLYHFAGTPVTSWAGFARAVFEKAGRKTQVIDIATADYPTPARRPRNSRLDCSTLSAFGLAAPDWRSGLDDVLKELGIL